MAYIEGGRGAGICESGIEFSDFIKGRKPIYRLSDYQLVSKDCAIWDNLADSDVVHNASDVSVNDFVITLSCG